VLISFVIGALTGVGMWFTTIQISPRTIGLMVAEFHWLWAIEWTFFCLEVTAGYAFYRYGQRLDDRRRLSLLVLYSLASWFSLFWINGILSWQLTPGNWTETHNVWDGFFNPSFWPSLCFRTIVAMTISSLVACMIIGLMPDLDRDQRTALINRAAHFLAPMFLMPLLGVWYFFAMPQDSREWVMGGSAAMTMFLTLSVGASMLIGAYATFGLLRRRLYINPATSGMLVILALAATAGGEFVREGIRKPFTVRQTLYSNSLTPVDIARLRTTGSVTNDPYPIAHADAYPQDQLRLGAKVFRFQCSICHTIEGANGLTHLAGSWTFEQQRMNIAQLQRTKTFMPPFAGNAAEVEALVQMIAWQSAGRPDDWPESKLPETLRQIQVWLDEAGTLPGASPHRRHPPLAGGQ
jgi:mono/diheme cytochrome c family protein